MSLRGTIRALGFAGALFLSAPAFAQLNGPFNIQANSGGGGAGGGSAFACATNGALIYSNTTKTPQCATVTFDTNFGLVAPGGKGYFWSGLGGITSSSDGVFKFQNNAGTTSANIAIDANNIISQRNGANAQSFRIYNTFTDASNGEWGSLDWVTSANFLTLATQKNGTGLARSIEIKSASSLYLTAASSSGVVFTIGVGEAFRVDSNLTFKPSVTQSTTMTTGFINIVGAAGAPTGVPATVVGYPLYIDTTNKKLCYYASGWECSVAFLP